MHAFRYALSLVSLVFSLVFEEVFFAGSASLHDWFLHFLESAFSVTLEKRSDPLPLREGLGTRIIYKINREVVSDPDPGKKLT